MTTARPARAAARAPRRPTRRSSPRSPRPAAGDTVKVCPGTYVGQVTIKGSRNGLVLRSVTNLGATIKAKDEADVRHHLPGDHRRCRRCHGQGLQAARAAAQQPQLLRLLHGRPSHPRQVREHHRQRHPAQRQRRLLRRLRRHPGHQWAPPAPSPTTSSRTTANNGILLDGASTKLTVDDNTVTFAFLNWSSATADSGILLDNGANGTIKNNTVNGPAAGPGNPSQPSAGIRARWDRLRRRPCASTTSPASRPTSSVQHANGGTIHDNTMTGGQVGLNLRRWRWHDHL